MEAEGRRGGRKLLPEAPSPPVSPMAPPPALPPSPAMLPKPPGSLPVSLRRSGWVVSGTALGNSLTHCSGRGAAWRSASNVGAAGQASRRTHEAASPAHRLGHDAAGGARHAAAAAGVSALRGVGDRGAVVGPAGSGVIARGGSTSGCVGRRQRQAAALRLGDPPPHCSCCQLRTHLGSVRQALGTR